MNEDLPSAQEHPQPRSATRPLSTQPAALTRPLPPEEGDAPEESAPYATPPGDSQDRAFQEGAEAPATPEAASTEPAPQARKRAVLLHPDGWTRRQVLSGIGVTVGVVSLGVGTFLALSASPNGPGDTQPGAAASSSAGSPVPTQGKSPTLNQHLQDWRTKQLVAPPAQRFSHQNGTKVVPLGVVDVLYPNPYNPYEFHLQGYLLGGEILAKNQLFWYLGLEAVDGTQFVAKFRVGPVDQAKESFGILVTEQSTDYIEGGGPTEFPATSFSPKTLAQALPVLADHCVVVTLIRQALPAEAESVPPAMRAEINQQAKIADQFAQFDVDASQHAPFARIPSVEIAPIRAVIDETPISFRSAADVARYPLVTQLLLRQSDHLFPKLASGS